MKKFLFAMLLSITSIASAQQQVPSAWAFSIANLQGSYYRALLEQANQNQTKYQFIPEHKPGAGGSIAASYVSNQEKVALLGTAMAYFVRPNLYPNTNTYKFDDFKPVHVMALSPAALVTKQLELSDILKKDKISIGTAGAGSGTHLMALKFKDYFPNKDIQIVPYKSSTEALQDVLGGHIDLAFEFLGDAEAKQAKILGVTGRNKIKNYTLLKDIGYPSQAEIMGVYLILVKKSIPDEQVDELRKIFVQAEKSSKVQDLYKSDYSSKPTGLVTTADYTRWYNNTVKYYRELTAGQQLE
jgi:tripartite-type tricarboxylate transporter receptor subunit TctC